MREEFVTMNEAAEMLGVSRATLWRRIQDGVIVAFQSDQDRRQRLIRRADIEEMLTPKIVELGKVLPAQNLAA